MTKITDINYVTQSWPTSGAVTDVNSGMNLVSGTATYVAADADNLNYDGTPNGSFIQVAEGDNCTFELTPASSILQGSETDVFHKWHIQPVCSDIPAASGANYRPFSIVSGGTRFTADFYVMEGDNGGINMLIGEFWTEDSKAGYPSTGASGSTPQIPYNKWSEIILHIHYDAAAPSESYIAVFLNGMLYYQVVGGNMTTQIAIADARDDVNNISLNTTSGSWSGISWRFAGGETWDGQDITINPRDDLRNSEDDLQQYFYADNYFDNTLAMTNKGFTMDTPTGALTWTSTNFVTGGVNLSTRRYVITGSTGGQGEVKTLQKLGNLTFNELGYATVAIVKSIRPNYSSTPPTLKMAIRNDSDTDDVIEITLDPTNRRLQQGGSDLLDGSGNPIVLDGDHYYGIYIHLKDDGTASLSVNNYSVDFSSEQSWFSAQLTDWTVQSLGVIHYTLTKGDSDFDLEPAYVFRWLGGSMMDSTSNADMNVLELPAPATYSVGNRITNNLGRGTATELIPGGRQVSYAYQTTAGLSGIRACNISIGRSGNSMASFITNNINNNAFLYTHGIRFTIMDGSSINDVAVTFADKEAVDAKLLLLQTDFTSMIQAFIANKNKVWLGDMVIRENATYDERSNEVQKRYNAWKTLYFYQNQTSDLQLELSEVMNNIKDIPTTYWGGADDVHFDDGEVEYARDMFLYRVVPPALASTVTNPASTDVVIKSLELGKEKPELVLTENMVGVHVDFDLTNLFNTDSGADLFELKISTKNNVTSLKTITLTRTADLKYRWSIASGDLTPLAQSGTTRQTEYYGQITAKESGGTVVFSTDVVPPNVLRIKVNNVIT